MGNDDPKKKTFEMNIQLIGDNLSNYLNSISESKNKNSIQNCWKFNYDNNLGVDAQINKYFDKLQQIKKKDKTICLKECLLVRIKEIFDPIVTSIISKVNELGQTQYMPIVLFLLENDFSTNMNFSIDEKKYKRIEPRLIMITKYDEKNPKYIEPLLLRFCSIHNELGDRFTVGEGENEEDYDLIEHYYPFNINIACIGRFGQGKSTGVNVILDEYKAKESAKGSSQTLGLTFYQARDQPIRLLDIPGFEDSETVKKAVEKFHQCGEKINKIKDNLHIILYFLNYQENRSFANLELPILEEVCNHKNSKVIYVVTHSKPDMDETEKEEKIDNINEGLQNITINSKIHNETLENGLLFASFDNVVFVNFHKDNKNGYEPFGINDLFKMIYIYFIKSEDYINSIEKNNPDNVKKQAEKLRAQAEDMLLSNKVWGGIVGILPGIDWALQKFVINKNAAKKLGEIYGIDVKYTDEKGNNINLNIPKLEYITANKYLDDTENLNKEITKIDIAKESAPKKAGNILKSLPILVGASALMMLGIGLAAAGALVGVGLGGYLTTKYCEDLINKFEDYYIKNAQIIENSYKKGVEYLLSKNK